MSVAVYANGMSIACKVASGKTIAAFPDVCLSPPAPPIPPIPYPNTAAASDTTDGSKTVQIGGEEVMLKDKSTFKTSTGNEAATKSFGMGVVTHQITGKSAFVAWSMDVKFEGENIPRHLDLMGHNEGSDPPNTPPWPYTDAMSPPAPVKPCDPSECTDSVSKDRYEELRDDTPTPAIRKRINGTVPLECYACLQVFAGLHADHIFPLKKITQIPGFACLKEDEQLAISNSPPENFKGICASCNGSKGSKTWHEWKTRKRIQGVNVKGAEWVPWVRQEHIQVSDELSVKLNDMVKARYCAGR